jgi:hypothetical protein
MWRIKLEPINPAPPVTRIFIGVILSYGWLLCFSASVMENRRVRGINAVSSGACYQHLPAGLLTTSASSAITSSSLIITPLIMLPAGPEIAIRVWGSLLLHIAKQFTSP